MAQPQRQADVYQDEMCPPNKRYALMDANKKIDLDNLLYDETIKSIFNSGKSKDGIGMKISSWMITKEMKLTEHYRVYAAVCGLRIPPRRSTRLTPPTPISTTDEADDLVLQDTLQVRLAEKKSLEEIEAMQKVEIVKEHLMAEEIEKLVEGIVSVKNVEVASSTLRKNDNQNDLGTRLEPKSDKESLKVEITTAEQPVNVYEKVEESAEDDYELRRREKRKHVEEIRHTPSHTTIRSLRIHSTLISSDTEKLLELTKNDLPPYLQQHYHLHSD
uniref:Uncharacterized protein n=1 Tax=Tanacetum cinerariifolium TaxID=118510 RepID=A0A6L2L222_TANCI|nr:hypothetical protein [Tanacetum cinerariifolium]